MLTNKEFCRQLLHVAIGLMATVAYYYDLITPLAIFLMIVVGILASILSKRVWLPFFSFFLKNFEREKQKKTFPGRGMIFFFVGFLLVIQLFDKNIALASMMVLTFGDSISHIVGGKYGQLRNIFNWRGKKLLEGTFAGILAGFLGALYFVSPLQALLGSAAAMIAEVVEIDFNKEALDDNFVVPLVAGTVMLLVQVYL